jgi:type I restriction enzyme M protein
MISKLSTNGIAGFLLANGALGDPDTKNIRKKMIENNLVEAIIVLPRNMFYSTDISVTLWIINKNKKARNGTQNGVSVKYRDRSEEILFVDLRRSGVEYEKKYIQLSDEEISKVVTLFHTWQREDFSTGYKDIPEYCYSADKEKIISNDYSLIPSKYIEFINKDIAIDYDKEMTRIKSDIQSILLEESESRIKLLEAFKGLGYEIKF